MITLFLITMTLVMACDTVEQSHMMATIGILIVALSFAADGVIYLMNVAGWL